MKKLIFILAVIVAGRASAEWPYNPDGGKFTNDPLSVYGRMWTTTVARVAAASNACDMVFIGGSQNQYWYDDDKAFKPIWSNYYGARRAVNLGIAGDNTAQILWRLDNYDFSHIQPKAVVMLIGFNDRNDTSNRIAAGVTQVLGRVRSYLPTAKVLLVSLTPCIDTNMTEKMLAVNNITVAAADQTNVFFVNTFAKFTPIPGTTNEWLGVDPADDLHYLSSGYELWAQEMEPLVAEFVGGAPVTQTPAQWRSSVEALPDPDADSALEDLQEGCRIEVTTRNSLKPTGNTSLNNFRAWTNSTGSYTNALYTNVLYRWQNNLPMTTAESNHLLMVKASYLRQAWDSAGALQRTGSSEAWDIYATNVRTNGEALMTNAFMGASLSAANIEDLRDYCIYIQMQLTNAERIPSQFGITRTKDTPFEIGENAPDFMLRKAETVFDSPTFTNAALQDMKMFLKPKGVLEVLRLFTGYTSTGGVCVAKSFPASVSNETDYVRRQTNSTKPVVLMLGKSSDVCLRRNIPIIDTLYQAYRDVADIYIVHISYHDSFSTAPYYYGPYAGGAAEKVPWQWTEEDFAQDVRRSMIRYPSVSIPFLTDEESHRNRNAFFTDGGDAHFVIIDREGKIAYAAPHLSSEGQNPFDAILQANDVEVELRNVLANDGLAETGRDRNIPNVPRQALIDAGGISSYRPTATVPLWLTGRITAIDTVSNTVTVLRPAVDTNTLWGYNIIQENNPAVSLGASYTEAPKNLALLNQWIASGEKEYTLAVGAGSTNFSFSTTVNTNVTEIYLNGLPVQIGSLAVGDFIGTMYNNTTDETNAVIKPLYFRASRNTQRIVASVNALSVAEGGSTNLTVRLANAPSADVTVAMNLSGDSDITLITASPLTFTTGNWDTAQTVTVQAAQDADGQNGTATLQLTASGIPTVDIALAEADDEAILQPAKNWRLIPLQIFDSTGSPGVSNLLQGIDGAAGSIAAGGSWTLTVKLPAMAQPGMLTYSFGDTNVAVSAEESLNSTDGSNGTWTNLTAWTYRPKNSYIIDRLQKIELSSNAAPRWMKLTISNYTASAIAVSNLAAHQFNAGGTNDYWVWLGASIQEMSIRHGVFKQLVKEQYGYDPVVFNTAIGGWTSGSLRDNLLAILTNHPHAKYVAVHIGGNDVSGGRPYPGLASGLSNNLEFIYSTIRSLGMEPVISRISFRAYTGDPAVVVSGVIVNEENGSLPYNTNLVDRMIMKYSPNFYDFGAGIGKMDPYTYFLNHTNELSADGVHVGTEGKQSWNKLWADAAGDVIYPTNAPPAVSISAPSTNLTAGTEASFSASASDPDGTITDYSWNFGDGSAVTNGSALTGVSHRFLLPGTYTVTVTASDDSGADVSGRTSNSLTVQVAGSAGAVQRVLIDFGASTSMTTGNWNNVTNNALGVQVTNLLNEAGSRIGASLEITDVFNDIRTANSVVSTLYPTNATKDYFRLASSVAPNDISGTIKLNGLDTGLLYDFIFYGGSTLSFGPTVRYIIGSSNVVLTHYNNITNTAAIRGVAPQPDGTVTVTVDNDSSGNGCLNVLEITYVVADEEPSNDEDGDGIPNDWEQQYFGGATNANPDAIAANGINTVREAYIAGLNPTDADASFRISDLRSLTSVLRWNSASGRVYTIYWSSNLLNGFQTLETNWIGGVFTDTVHSAEQAGFYKINVQIQQ